MGSIYFRGGPYISEIYGLGGPNISKYMDRGEQKKGGVQICRDIPHKGVTTLVYVLETEPD